MPGISLKCDLTKKKIKADGNDGSDELFLKGLNSIIYDECYKQEILLKEDPYLVGCTKYPEYPIKVFENNEFWICIEGKIYGKQHSVLNNEINDLMNRIFSTRSVTEKDKKIIADWLLKTDGDYVVYALNKKTKDFVIMNDVLGRLPLYYYCKDGIELIVSREVEFISYLIHDNDDNDNKFDKMGIAQYLLFSHTLGKRTLLSNIYRLEPASLLRICNNNSEIKIDTLYRFNFENKQYTNNSLKKNAQELVSLFSEGCKNRVDYNTKNIISLSGGLDSRIIAASFHKDKIPGYGVTSTEPHWRPVVGSISEAEIAEQLSKSLNIDWENYGIMKPRAKDIVMLLRIKNGLYYLAYSFLLPFLDRLKHKHGSTGITFFTGNGGNLTFENLSRKISNMNDLVINILQRKDYFSIRDVTALVQIKESEIVDEVRKILSSYPEENLSQKRVHFIIYEYYTNFYFETEDIHRFYFWTVSPFYSIPFFKYIMNCPDKHKSQHALYREFLFMMSPSAAAIKNSNWGCSILSKKYKILQSILSLSKRYPMFSKIIKKIKDKKGYKDNSRIIRCMRDQVNSCNVISNYLSRKEIEKIMNNGSNYNQVGIDNLFAITSLMEKTLCDNNTIEKYYVD